MIMKKIFFLCLFLGFLCSVNAKAQVAQSAADAAMEAKVMCNQFGMDAKPSSKEDAHGQVYYNSSNRNEQTHVGGQNNTRVTAGVKSGTVVKGGGEAEYRRTGEQNNSNNQSTRTSTGTMYYRCEERK